MRYYLLLYSALLALYPAFAQAKTEDTSATITYLDYAASWQISEPALIELIRALKLLGNSSGITPHSKILREMEQNSAQIIANKINASHWQQIHFVNSASIANNIAVLGVAYKNPGCHLITSKIEHKSVLNVFKYLEEKGYKITYLNVDKQGKVDLDQLRKCINSDTRLISVQMLNSEIGTLQNMAAIGRIAKQHKILFHSDASQAFCKYPIDVKAMGIDLITLSGYKIGAPQGIAALYVQDSKTLQPILFGSGDELFPGTKPTALICSFAKAVETFKFDWDKIRQNYSVLKNELQKIEGIHINSSSPSHILSVSIDGVLLRDILEYTELFSFSAGCSCLGQEKSNVIEAIDPDEKLPGCTIRISFSDQVDTEVLRNFVHELSKIITTLRAEKSVGNGCESQDESISPEAKKNAESLKDELFKIQKMLVFGHEL